MCGAGRGSLPPSSPPAIKGNQGWRRSWDLPAGAARSPRTGSPAEQGRWGSPAGSPRQCHPSSPGEADPRRAPRRAGGDSAGFCARSMLLPRPDPAPPRHPPGPWGHWGWLCPGRWPRLDTRTSFEDEEVQGIVTQVGRCGDLVGGDAQDQLLVVAPGEQEAAGREAEDAVLLRRRLQRQLLQLLRGQSACQWREAPGGMGHLVPTLWAALWGTPGGGGFGTPLTLAVSSSCSTSSRLEGFREAVTHVRWPKNWEGGQNPGQLGGAGARGLGHASSPPHGPEPPPEHPHPHGQEASPWGAGRSCNGGVLPAPPAHPPPPWV